MMFEVMYEVATSCRAWRDETGGGHRRFHFFITVRYAEPFSVVM